MAKLGATDADAAGPAYTGRLRAAVGDRYDVLRTVGRGGMATVFLARDRKLERDVAIKVLHPEVASAVGGERFLREVLIAASLRHPHIVALFDSGTADGLPYYVMPYVAGQSLRDRMNDEGRLPVDDAVRIAREVSAALAHAHAQGVVHRDIKPENILLAGYLPRPATAPPTTPSGGGGWHAQVADFGIAAAGATDQRLTTVGVILGTPHYMSPEQTAGGVVDVDGRTDQYATACVLYEMLAGEPPFTGSSAAVLFAQHASEAPPSVRAVRAEVPRSVERAIRRAMAKHPADRYASMEDFVAALDPAGSGPRDWVPPLSPRRWRATALAAGGLAALVAVAALVVAGGRSARLPAAEPGTLDPSRVMVFAPEPADGRPADGAGESVATLIGYALDGTATLTWLRGSDWLDGRRPDRRVMEEVSAAHRAAFYVDGTVVRQRDSTTVILLLHRVGTEAPVARAAASGRDGEETAPLLGLRAVSELLVPLLAPGRKVDISPLAQRRPAAIANFLRGEDAYREGRFGRALELYGAAVAADSNLALAAVKGSWAAAWLGHTDDASALAAAALRRTGLLPPRYAELALGSSRLVAGAADSAAASFRRALALDPRWSEGWMGLGEVYYHLLPSSGAPLDSLAEAAFEQARRGDPGFSPPLYHLAEIALREGAVADAERLTRAARTAVGASPDSGPLPRLELALRCVRGGPGAVDWRALLSGGQDEVESVGKLLSAGPAHSACARAAFWSVLADKNSPRKWGPAIGLFGLLAAAGRVDDAVAFTRLPPAQAMGAEMFTVLAAAAHGEDAPPALASAAAQAAASLGQDYARMSATQLWLLAAHETRGGRAEPARSIARALAAKADSTHARRDSLLAASAAARAVLAAGDTSGAMRRLAALRPSAPFGGLQWDLWEPLGGEYLLLARLQLARGEHRAAAETAARLDSQEPVAFLFYLRPSLQLRLQAAEAMGDSALATRCRARLAALDADQVSVPWTTHATSEGGKDGTSH